MRSYSELEILRYNQLRMLTAARGRRGARPRDVYRQALLGFLAPEAR